MKLSPEEYAKKKVIWQKDLDDIMARVELLADIHEKALPALEGVEEEVEKGEVLAQEVYDKLNELFIDTATFQEPVKTLIETGLNRDSELIEDIEFFRPKFSEKESNYSLFVKILIFSTRFSSLLMTLLTTTQFPIPKGQYVGYAAYKKTK